MGKMLQRLFREERGSMSAVAVQEGRPAASKGRGGPTIPFVVGSHQVIEGPFADVSRLIDANGAAFGPFDVSARGFLRNVWLLIEGSAGTLGAGVLHEDYPYTAIDQLVLADPNGTTYFGPMSGYSAYICNFMGAYGFETDPAADPDFVGTINFSFWLRVPVELTAHDAYGALLNQDAAAPFRIQFRQTVSSANYTTAPTTPATVRYRAFLEAWEDPPNVDRFGNGIEQFPPGFPTTQYWTEQVINVPVSGTQTFRLNRVGNPIRNLALIYRTGATIARSTTSFPDPIRLTWDARDVYNMTRRHMRALIFERYGRAQPTGVFNFDFTSDPIGHAGNEGRKLYLPTTDATRLEIVGNFTVTTSATLTVLTNDVAPAGFAVRT
jgi:hypothetical protein